MESAKFNEGPPAPAYNTGYVEAEGGRLLHGGGSGGGVVRSLRKILCTPACIYMVLLELTDGV